MSITPIPLHEPIFSGNEIKYLTECIETAWVSTAGKFVNLFEDNICEYTGAKYAVACASGTAALHVSLRVVGVMPGDEVIVPSLTFIAPVNAVKYCNANPIFMDADDFYNIDVQKTIDFINQETKFRAGSTYNKTTRNRISAIVPVHVWGNAVLLDELVALCKGRNIALIEDASEGLGVRYSNENNNDEHVGTLGTIGCISFNGNKIITSGGGGVIITDDEKLAEHARYLTTQAKDDPIRYVHNEVGYNYRLTNIQAAVGVAQLEQLPKILQQKAVVRSNYSLAFKNVGGLRLSRTPDYARSNYWLNIVRVESENYLRDRENLLSLLIDAGVQSRPVWALIHEQAPYRHAQTFHIENAYRLVDSSLCIPSSATLTLDEIEMIVEVMNE
jgi:perosamine synthetase